MVVELDEKEKVTLKAVLEMVEEELKGERARTDRRDWRNAIHNEEGVIKSILKKVA